MSLEPALPRELAFAARLEHAGRSLYRFREETRYAIQFALVLGMAGLTGLSAQISIPLPFTPVPLTGQVFAVLVAGGLLGRYLGPASQVAYLALGALGVPWFAPNTGAAPFTNGGTAALVGVTGGYLLGFIAAAALTGWLLDRGLAERRFPAVLATMLAGVGVVYTVGALQFALLLHTSAATTLLYAVLPFLPGDMLKAVVATVLLAGVVSVVPGAARTDPAETRAAPLRRRDLAGALGLVALVWAGVPALVLPLHADRLLTAYYLTAAAVSTVAIGAALGVRESLARALRRYRARASAAPA